ncbi:MAG: TadE family protein [Candidatus Eisenbacteria bacterium]
MRLLGRKGRRSDGQALVEFALLVPLLAILVLGIVEFGRIWMTMNVLASAAREGARIAAVTSPDQARVQTAVENLLNAADITGATVTTTGPNADNEVTVRVQIDYTVVTGSFVPGLSGTMQLSRSVVIHWEG